MRAVIYARYSSDKQREASIEDQVAVCRRYAAAQGWAVVGTYTDAALSGANRFRPEFQLLMGGGGRREEAVQAAGAVGAEGGPGAAHRQRRAVGEGEGAASGGSPDTRVGGDWIDVRRGAE